MSLLNQYMQFVIFAVLAIMAMLAFVVTVKLLSGQINTLGMLREMPGGPIQPERLLMLMATLATAFAYASYGLANGVIPDVPVDAVTALGGGNLIYLVGKRMRQ